MNTLPIGFTLEQAPPAGQCALIVDLCDTRPGRPPRLRVTVNGQPYDRDLDAGASENSLRGDWLAGKAQSLRVEFPATLLRVGYNEIALRSMKGSWMVFDDLRLEAPAGAKLAPPANTVIRSVTAAPYAVSNSKKTPATLRIGLFRAGGPGKLKVVIENGGTRELETAQGLQVLEVPAPASAPGRNTRVELSAEGRVLCETQVSLPASPIATPADYVDPIRGTAHSRWMIGPGPWLPFSMVKISPDNQTAGWCSG